MPPALDITMLSDRTQTIRASVADVEFELVLAVILVVLVIFVFLRNAAATIIPSESTNTRQTTPRWRARMSASTTRSASPPSFQM